MQIFKETWIEFHLLWLPSKMKLKRKILVKSIRIWLICKHNNLKPSSSKGLTYLKIWYLLFQQVGDLVRLKNVKQATSGSKKSPPVNLSRKLVPMKICQKMTTLLTISSRQRKNCKSLSMTRLWKTFSFTNALPLNLCVWMSYTRFLRASLLLTDKYRTNFSWFQSKKLWTPRWTNGTRIKNVCSPPNFEEPMSQCICLPFSFLWSCLSLKVRPPLSIFLLSLNISI